MPVRPAHMHSDRDSDSHPGDVGHPVRRGRHPTANPVLMYLVRPREDGEQRHYEPAGAPPIPFRGTGGLCVPSRRRRQERTCSEDAKHRIESKVNDFVGPVWKRRRNTGSRHAGGCEDDQCPHCRGCPENPPIINRPCGRVSDERTQMRSAAATRERNSAGFRDATSSSRVLATRRRSLILASVRT